MSNSIIEHGIVLSYRDVFGDYDQISFPELVQGISTETVLRIACYYAGKVYYQGYSSKPHIKELEHWSQRFPADIQDQLAQLVESRLQETGKFLFLNRLSTLTFIQKTLCHYEAGPIREELSPAEDLNLFKAYLYATQVWQDRQAQTFDNYPHTGYSYEAVYLTAAIGNEELKGFKDIRPPFISAIHFFQFCENDDVFSRMLNVFLTQKGLSDWREYLKNLLSLYLIDGDMQGQFKQTRLVVGGKYESFKEWLQCLCVDPESYQPKYDFLELRENPVFRLGPDDFLVLDPDFVIDKLFQGIKFDMGTTLMQNKFELNGRPIKSRDSFFSYLAEHYSERRRFYDLIPFLFSKDPDAICLSGEQIKPLVQDGEPDYYVRIGKHIFLFEYKDVTLNATVKQSYLPDKVLEELRNKFVENEKGKPKGIRQLHNTVVAIQSGSFASVDSGIPDDLEIYPLIVFTDPCLKVPGVNYFIQRWADQDINQRQLRDGVKVHPAIMIHMDTLILHQDRFHNLDILTIQIFRDYLQFLNQRVCVSAQQSLLHPLGFELKIGGEVRKEDLLIKLVPFDVFLAKRLLAEPPNGLYPAILRDQIGSLFKKS
ncbi:MAG: hypothetical protein NW241_02430 [Bacteroidia bacterium]|nr:hypothetical protein [Bacteroidia bacterium]